MPIGTPIRIFVRRLTGSAGVTTIYTLTLAVGIGANLVRGTQSAGAGPVGMIGWFSASHVP